MRNLRLRETSWPRALPKPRLGSQVWGFLWGLGLVGLRKDHPCLPAALLPIRKAQTLGQAGNVSGGAARSPARVKAVCKCFIVCPKRCE